MCGCVKEASKILDYHKLNQITIMEDWIQISHPSHLSHLLMEVRNLQSHRMTMRAKNLGLFLLKEFVTEFSKVWMICAIEES